MKVFLIWGFILSIFLFSHLQLPEKSRKRLTSNSPCTASLRRLCVTSLEQKVEAQHSLSGTPPRLQEHSLQTAGCRHPAEGKSTRSENCHKSVLEITVHSGCRVARATTAMDFFFPAFQRGKALMWWDWSRVADCSQRAEGTRSHCGTHSGATAVPTVFSPDKGRLFRSAAVRAADPPLETHRGSPPGTSRHRRHCQLRPVFLVTHTPWAAASLSLSPDAPELRAAHVTGTALLSPSLLAAPQHCSAVTGAVSQVSHSPQRCQPHSITPPIGFSPACNTVSFLTSDYLTLHEFESDTGYEMESYILEINGKALIFPRVCRI